MFNKSRIIFLGIGIFTAVALALFLFLLEANKQKLSVVSFPTPTPYKTKSNAPSSSSYSFSPFQKTIIGQTTDEELSFFATIIDQSTSANGITTYNVKSVNPIRPDQIITKNKVVVFEKTSTFTSDYGGFPKSSFFIKTFGQPEEKIQGHSFYGEFATTYVFAKKGFSLVVNPFTDEVYEIQRFYPSSTNEYKEKYGSDMKTVSQKENL